MTPVACSVLFYAAPSAMILVESSLPLAFVDLLRTWPSANYAWTRRRLARMKVRRAIVPLIKCSLRSHGRDWVKS